VGESRLSLAAPISLPKRIGPPPAPVIVSCAGQQPAFPTRDQPGGPLGHHREVGPGSLGPIFGCFAPPCRLQPARCEFERHRTRFSRGPVGEKNPRPAMPNRRAGTKRPGNFRDRPPDPQCVLGRAARPVLGGRCRSPPPGDQDQQTSRKKKTDCPWQEARPWSGHLSMQIEAENTLRFAAAHPEGRNRCGTIQFVPSPRGPLRPSGI